VIIALLLAVIAVLLVRQQPAPGPADASPTLAVLPFKQLGGDPGSPFGFGLADTMIHKLGQLQGLVVLTSSSTFQFADSPLELGEVAAKLGASVLLEGTVQQVQEQLRVNARLVEAASGMQLWSGSYDRASGDLFAVQDEISLAVSEALALVLTPNDRARLARPVASSISAYDAYTLGRLNLARRGAAVETAIAFFRQAVELDAGFALAHAALAEALYMAPFYLRADTSWDQVAEEAWAAAKAAQRIDPQLAEAYLAEFYVSEADNRHGMEKKWNDTQLRALLEQALARNPSQADAARYLARYGETLPERRRLLERAARLDPRSGIVAYEISNAYAEEGAFDEANEWALRAGATADPYFPIGYNNVAIIYGFYAGQLDEGVRWARLFARELGGNFRLIYYSALWDLGVNGEARTLLDDIIAAGDPDLDLWILSNRYISAWRAGQQETAANLWQELEEQHLKGHPSWPDLRRFPGSDWLLALRAITDLRQGDPQQALERYRTALPNPETYPTTLSSGVFLDPVLMTAALLKASGQRDAGREMIRGYLEAHAPSDIVGHAGMGYGRFLAHALLGDAAAASRELQAILDAPFAALHWQLEVARFDPDVAAVLDSPAVAPLYQDLLRRIASMRDAYVRNPDLAPEAVPERFRDTLPGPI
jgi:TolB-like protein